MNLRSKFFKKPWQHRDEQVRAQAISNDQDAELKAELPRLAQSDESPAVRLAALKRLDSEPFWLDARLRENDAEIQRVADQFLAREVMRSDRPELDEARLEWLALTTDADLIRRIASSSPSLTLRRAALARISAQGFLGDCYLSESNPDLALELLVRIDQISTLERVLQKTRKSSKQRAQAAAERLEALKIAAGETAPGQGASERLVQAAENLARGRVQGDLATQLEDLRSQWESSSDHPAPLALRFAGAVKIIEGTLRRRDESPPAEASDSTVESAAGALSTEPEEAASPALAAAADFVRSTIRDSGAKGKSVSVRELLAHWDRAWNALPQPGAPDRALKDDMLPLLRELQAQMQMQSQTKTAADPVERSDKPQTVNLQEPLDQVAELLEAGDLTAIHERIQELRREYDRLPQRQRRSADGGRLQRMEGRLKEMRNWQHWSNNQARDVLIAQLEKLRESGQHPDAIMAALKQARAEWSRLEALEVLPGDKRRYAAPPGQWRQFQAACKQAYELGKPYFEKRDQLLQDNLKTLQDFIQAGQEAADSETSTTETLIGFQRKARQAIRRMDDLPPKARGRSAAALRELMNRLSASLDARFESIEATKRRLVAEARALGHEKDLKAAIDKAKALQSQWQKVGSGRRKVEQELWQAFREPIDPLFQQVKGEQDQRRQVQEEVRAELQSRCEQVEALAALPEQELEEARGRLLGLIDDWLNQDNRPESLNRRFELAEQRYEQRLSDYQARQRTGAEQQLRDIASEIQSLWSARCDGQTGDLTDQVASRQDLSGLGAALFDLAQLLAQSDFDQAAFDRRAQVNAEAARQIAVELEFLSGLDTPASDQALRMDYQVQRLAKRMSERERRPDLATELEQRMERWYRALPLPPSQHTELAARVDKARDILRGMAGL